MFYDYVRLHKCNRTTKPTIVIRPTKRIQMVLGTNGSGKSSIVSIGFSPMPADLKADFHPGGGREVHIHDRGRKFKLEERYDQKMYYSFIVDGEEKNDGHTITVQLELCKEYFNYTREIHDFITGKTQFTKLNAQQRRDWVARMSESDFSYAFRQFERFRKGYSAASSVVTFLRGRLNEERKRLLEPDDAIEMRARAAILKAEIRSLMSIPRSEGGYFSMADLQDEYNALFNSFDVFSRMEYPRLLQGGKTYDDLVDDLSERSSALKAVQEERGRNLEDLNQRLERIKKLMSVDPDALTDEHKHLTGQLESLPMFTIDINPSLIVRCDAVIQALREACADLPATRVTHDVLMSISDRLQSRQIAFSKADNLLNTIGERLHQIERCDAVTCPSCQHGFKPGINPSEVGELRDRQTKGEEFVKVVTGEVRTLSDELAEADNNYKAFSELDIVRRRYIQQHPGIFAYLDSVGGFDLGRGLYEKLAMYERAVSLHEKSSALSKRIDEIKNALESYEREGAGFTELTEQRNVLFKSYRQTFEDRTTVNLELDGVRKDKAYDQRFDQLYGSVEEEIEAWKSKLVGYLDREAEIMADEEIAKLQTTLAINETALAEDDLVMTIVKDLEQQLEKKLIEQAAYKHLTDAMSPKTGLIAEQITAQIGAIVGGVNQMIKRVWQHPLFIQMPEREGGDLDYKFPIVDENRLRRDIADGSDSMLEIVNRAFVLTLYYCLNMTGYPLFLDEPGRTFDETHAQNLIPLIKDLVDSDRFSQILIISHDSDTQRAFPDSEVIIIDDRNINYPHPYNEHVEFEYAEADN